MNDKAPDVVGQIGQGGGLELIQELDKLPPEELAAQAIELAKLIASQSVPGRQGPAGLEALFASHARVVNELAKRCPPLATAAQGDPTH